MMHCIGIKPDNYVRLLNFARLSKNSDKTPNPNEEIVQILNSLLAPSSSIYHLIGPIYPHLYRSTKQANLRDRILPDVMSHLRNATFRIIAADIIQKQWLSNIINTLIKNGISVILLKSAAFAGSLYSDDTPRIGVDIDLLVNNDEFELACSLLGKMMDVVAPDTTRMATHSTLFERVFSARKNGGPLVEIHRWLTNPYLFKIEEKDLWAISVRHPTFKSENIRILSPEDTLLHLAVHAFRHLDFCTHNLLDAHEIWCQWEPDPDTLFLRAEQWRARKVLYYLLFNCKTNMQTPVPETLLDRLRPNSIIDTINRKILRSEVSVGSTNISIKHRLRQLISQVTFPDRFWYGLKHQLSYGFIRLLDWIISLKRR